MKKKESYSDIKKIIEKGVTDFEKEKEFFKNFLDTPNAEEKINGIDGRFSIKDDLRQYFSKVKQNRELKDRFEKHRNLNLQENNKDFKFDRNDHDSRIEFMNITKKSSTVLEKPNLVSKNKTDGIENQFLYNEGSSEKVESEGKNNNPAEVNKRIENLRKSKNPFNKSRTESDLFGKKKNRRSTTKVLFDKIISGIKNEKKFCKKSNKEKKNMLKKFKNKILESLKDVDKKIEQINKKIEKNQTELKNGTTVFRNNSLRSLCDYFRKYTINKGLKLDLEMTIENKKKVLLEKRKERVDQALEEFEKTKKFPFYIREEFFCSVENIFSGNKDVENILMQIKILDGLINQMETIYQIERKIKAKGRSKKEIRRDLRDVITHAKSTFVTQENFESFEDCIYQDDIQDQFNKIIRDIRTIEGQSIDTFLKNVRSYGIAKIPPSEVKEYIESYVDLIMNLHKVKEEEEEYRTKLKQLADRLFFSLIGEELFLKEVEEDKNVDIIIKKIEMLKQLPPESLGVNPKFLDKGIEYMPFQKAINILNNIEYCTSPNDMIWTIDCCSKHVIKEANEMCKKNGKSWTFGADELLPVLIHVLVHSDIPFISCHLSFISKYGTEKNSESSYYLTCFEGAMMYVQDLKEAELIKLIEENKKKL